jgi:hypothetical protein
MRTIQFITAAFTSFMIANSAIASVATTASLVCRSENIQRTGQLQSTYVRMGASVFGGNFKAVMTSQKTLPLSVDFTVGNGDMQEDVTFYSDDVIFSNGIRGQMNIVQDGPSFIQSGNQRIEFTPHCEMKAVPQACESSPSLGLNCSTGEDGSCHCTHHNTH